MLGSTPILLSLGSNSNLGFNPRELYETVAGRQGLYDQRYAFCWLVKRACPASGHKQQNLLETALEPVYLAAGILANGPPPWNRTQRMADLDLPPRLARAR